MPWPSSIRRMLLQTFCVLTVVGAGIKNGGQIKKGVRVASVLGNFKNLRSPDRFPASSSASYHSTISAIPFHSHPKAITCVRRSQQSRTAGKSRQDITTW